MISARWLIVCIGIAGHLAGLLLTGCKPEQDLQSKQTTEVLTAEELALRPGFYGGDTNAWPTGRGSNSDIGYCNATLKLPLATEPKWMYTYSAAEYSAQPVTDLIHYDGRIVLIANSPQLVLLNADDGSMLFNADKYLHKDSDLNEGFKRVYGHPQGLLLGQDDLGRYYVWDIIAPELPRLWVGEEIPTGSGFVTDGSLMLTSWYDNLSGLNVLTGEVEWEVPSFSQPGGIVMSINGVEVWWTDDGRLYALLADNGTILWSITTIDMIDRAVIDDDKERVYIAYGSEKLECRQLVDGDILWQYSWAELLSDDQRQYMFDEAIARVGTNTATMAWTGTHNLLDDISLHPSGPVLSLSNGYVIAFDEHGNELWNYIGQSTVTRLVAFNNAVLVGELYGRPEAFPWERAVFCLEAPDWPVMQSKIEIQQQALEELSSEQQGTNNSQDSAQNAVAQQELFFRFVALDIQNGQELSVFEPDLFPCSQLVPARDCLVFGEAPSYWAMTGSGSRDRKHHVLAYPWIEREGE